MSHRSKAEKKSTPEESLSADLSFRRRALVEAARYGSDPWVFVRELLQNARDAGARRVVFETLIDEGMERLTCRDDGAGMSFAHAERYLFALYASSKEEEETQAGQFGIGFWSVLRFQPTSIVIRSRAAVASPWEVALDGQLEDVHIKRDAFEDLPQGTEIVLERPIEAETLADRVLRAARRHGRFLTRRDSGRGEARELEVVVDGQRINESFHLPAPSAQFEGRGFRGVVALGNEPQVELFAHGLFVRSAKSLEELLDGDRRRRDGESAEDALAELPSLAPHVLLDSNELELLLARSDARQNRHLSKLVRRAEKELARLVESKLNALRPQPWYRIWWGTLQERLEVVGGRPLTAALVAGLVLGGILGLGFARGVSFSGAASEGWGPEGQARTAQVATEGVRPTGEASPPPGVPARDVIERETDGTEEWTPEEWTPVPPDATGAPPPALDRPPRPISRPYRDLARRYQGPRVDSQDHTAGPIGQTKLVYAPPTGAHLWNALVVDDLNSGRPAEFPPSALKAYLPAPCTVDCLDVFLNVEAEEGLLRLPIPTGHRLTTSAVRLGARTISVFETPQGEAVLLLDGPTVGPMVYRTGAAPAPPVLPPPPLRAHTELQEVAARLLHLPRGEQITEALAYVAARVRYSRTSETVRAFDARRGSSFLSVALDVGAGDCDVQNGVLTALLRELGMEARMVVGYVGMEGVVAPGLHAWVEVRADDGRWRAVDASLGAPVHPLAGAAHSDGVPQEDVLAAIAANPAVAGEPSRWRSPQLPLFLGLGLLLGSVAFLGLRKRGGAAELDLGSGGDLAALLGGALRHPAAFAAMPAVFHGRFVPLVGGGESLSLHRARRLAGEHRLFRSEGESELAQKAAAKGVPIVDGRTPEGKVLSRAFGAIDLDHWGDLLERCHETEASRRIDRGLQALGEPWRLREAPELPEAAVEIALEDLRLGRRLVLVDPEHPDLAALLPMAESARRDFALLDALAPHLEQGAGDAARVLGHFAAAAVEEVAREAAREAAQGEAVR